MTPFRAELPRQLQWWDAVSIVIGIVIGAGIFLAPSVMAQSLPSPTLILLMWLVGGVLSFFGALAYAELGAMLPATGGEYVFLREIYGPAMAFLCGWTLLLVVLPAQVAALAVGFTTYLGYFVPLSPREGKAVALTLLGLLTLANYRGAKSAARLQNATTLLKLAGLGSLIVGAFVSGRPNQLHLSTSGWTATSEQLGAAMVICFLSYDGWNNVSSAAGEIVRPQRNVPIALGVGLAVITGIYLLTNLAFFSVLPLSEIAGTERVGTLLAQTTLGRWGAAIVTLTILCSMTGSINGGLLTAPRLYFAQARDGLLFRALGTVHPRFQTPSVAIVTLGVWAAALAMTGSYVRLVTYVIFCSWIFYALVVAGLIILRRRQPDRARPYRMWGYPVTPVLFLLAAVWFLLNRLWATPAASLTGLGIILAGLPVYWLWRRKGLANDARRLTEVA